MVEVKKETLSVRVHITLEDIENLLYSAAQGSSYWCENQLGFESEVKKTLSGRDVSVIDDFEANDNHSIRHLLDLKKIKRGLTVMAKKERSHFCDFINDNADMNTADVFLQCCLFGEVLYS